MVVAKNLAGRESEIGEQMAKIYASDFTEQELKDLVTFYKSTLGQKLLAEEPKTIAASMAFMILSECDLRYAWPDSLLLFHPVKVQTHEGISADAAAALAKDLAALEVPLKERLVHRLGVGRKWVEENYRNETMHRGSTLATKAPTFLFLVDSYEGISPLQLNPPPPEKDIIELLFGGHKLPSLFWRRNGVAP